MTHTDFQNLGIAAFETYYYRWYDTPTRAYHNTNHAIRVVDECFDSGLVTPALILAALYHDAVYIPGSDVNEKSSALALVHDARSMHRRGHNVDLGVVMDACDMINQTTIPDHLRSAVVLDPELAVLLDADLVSLSDPYDVFLNTQRDIMVENFLDPYSKDNMRKSAQFLKQFLECRTWIYHTDSFRQTRESIARENITRFLVETGV